MIGNDIVDLALARQESNWRRKGFLHKIFTPYEQQRIRTATDPEQMVWLLWSMKESAYKIVVRDSGKRVFTPTKLVCQLTELDGKGAKGIVCYVEKEYLTKSSFTPQYIATVSINKKGFLNCRTSLRAPDILPVQAGCLYNSCLHSGEQMYQYLPHSSYHSGFDHIIVPLPQTPYPQQHPVLWKKIRQHCSVALSVPKEEIYLYKDETGAPWMTFYPEEKTPLTVSHHGRFGAFAFLKFIPTHFECPPINTPEIVKMC